MMKAGCMLATIQAKEQSCQKSCLYAAATMIVIIEGYTSLHFTESVGSIAKSESQWFASSNKEGRENKSKGKSYLKDHWISSRVLPLVSGTQMMTNAKVRAHINM